MLFIKLFNGCVGVYNVCIFVVWRFVGHFSGLYVNNFVMTGIFRSSILLFVMVFVFSYISFINKNM